MENYREDNVLNPAESAIIYEHLDDHVNQQPPSAGHPNSGEKKKATADEPQVIALDSTTRTSMAGQDTNLFNFRTSRNNPPSETPLIGPPK